MDFASSRHFRRDSSRSCGSLLTPGRITSRRRALSLRRRAGWVLQSCSRARGGRSRRPHLHGRARAIDEERRGRVRRRRPQDRVHFEWFTAVAVDTASDTMSDRLVQSDRVFEVPPGRSILEVLEDNDCGVPYSCREGLCATCRTCVVSGECDHRDSVLSATERASNKEIMVCVSGAKSLVLELDL